MSRVVVVGSINLDTVMSVTRLPATGETLSVHGLRHGGGGKGANAALASARSAAPTTLVGCVGADAAADAAVDGLSDAGVDLRLTTVDGAPTGTATVVVDARGDNCVLVHPGANTSLNRHHVIAALRGYKDISVVLTNLEVPDEAVLAAAELASRHRAVLIVNPAPARPLPPQLMRHRPILTPNEGEAHGMTGDGAAAAAAATLYARTGAPAIVTCGAAGVYVSGNGDVRHLAAPRVDAVDTTGAGDIFNGSFAAELARGKPVLAAARVAVQRASDSTRGAGARFEIWS